MSLLVALLVACGGTPEPPETPTTPREAAVPDPRAPGWAAPPDDPALAAALARIRDAEPPCYGQMASVDVWRTEQGAVHRLYYHGSITDCSHAPSVWFDPEGAELEAVANEPVTDENRAYYDAIWARHTTGAEKAERLGVLGPAQ